VKGKSTNDVIFAVRKIFENARYDGGEMHAILIDFEKAFPSINRFALKHILLNKVKLSLNMVDRIMDLLSDSKDVVSCGKDSVCLTVNHGVRLGCPLGPILFLVVIAELVNEVKVDFPNIMTYADDLTFMSNSEQTLQDVLLKVIEKGDKYGLKANANKTEYISVVDRKFVKEAKLLGAWIGNDDISVNNNIRKAKSSFYAFYHSIWKHPNVDISTKMIY
jgi:Reverse transcriptase (RNA-dependent DNA polymerase)